MFPRSPSHLTVRAKDEESDRPGCFPDPRVRSLRASLLRRISVDSAAWSVSLALRRASFYYRDSTSLCRESKNSMSLCSRDAISPFPWFSIERQIAIYVIEPHPLKCRSHYVIATKLSRKIGHHTLFSLGRAGCRFCSCVVFLFPASCYYYSLETMSDQVFKNLATHHTFLLYQAC